MVSAGRKLVHFSADRWGDKPVFIGFIDYTGHRSKPNGCHFTAKHELHVTEEELFNILEPYFVRGPGNEPDMAECEGCKAAFFSDELEIENWQAHPLRLLCEQCRTGNQAA